MAEIVEKFLPKADDPIFTEGYSVYSLRKLTKSTDDTPSETDGKTRQKSVQKPPSNSDELGERDNKEKIDE